MRYRHFFLLQKKLPEISGSDCLEQELEDGLKYIADAITYQYTPTYGADAGAGDK